MGEEQPSTDLRSSRTIVFDGRLDNRADLLALLDDAAAKDVPDCGIVLGLHERFGDDFVRRLEELAGCQIVLVSVGPRRDQTIILRNPFA